MTEMLGDFLAHFGVKGMKWGVVRKNVGQPNEVVISAKPGGKVTAKGGENHPASEDAKKVATSKQLAKKSTTDALSTKDLQELVNRMNLEQQYANLSSKEMTPGKQFAKDFQKNTKLVNDVITFTNSPTGKMVTGVIGPAIKGLVKR